MADDSKAKPSKKSDKEVLTRAKKRFAYVVEYDDANRKSQKSDTEFVYVPGAQWPDKTRSERTNAGDPCMEFNQLKQFVNQVVNDQRQGRPGIRIHPASGDASEEVAEILQGLIRGIEYDSRAESVYDCGYQHSVVGGRGYWRIVSEYESEESFNQKLCIKRIADPLSVYLDPDYQEPDGGDREYGFVVESVPLDVFKERWPGAQAVNVEAGDEHWYPDDDHILVADYYERTTERRTLVLLSDGNQAYKEDLPAQLPPGVTVISEREVDAYKVDWYTIAGGDQLLKTHEWPGKIIPLVCTMGDEIVVAGKRLFQGLITQAKDSAALFNFGMTQQAITLSLTPRAPYVAAQGAIQGYEPLWNNANTSNVSVLPYKAYDAEGRQMPEPRRQQASTPDSGWLNWTQQMTGLMRSTIGMYENSLGQKGQETSGRAILAREKQGDNSTYHFQDNLARAIALTGRILVGCIPTYYDTQRIVQIIGADDSKETVAINEPAMNPANPLEAIKRNDVTVGTYAVTVEAGPSYATKRQETADLLMGMVSAYPPLMQIAGDLIMRAQDVPDADLIAERLKQTLPPQILQSIAQNEAEKKGQQPIPEAARAQITQMQQQLQQAQEMMQQLQAENQQLQTGEKSKQAKIMADAEAAKVKAAADAQRAVEQAQIDGRTALEVAEIKAQADAAAKIRVAEIDSEAKQRIAAMGLAVDAANAEANEGQEVERPEAGDKPMLVVMQALAESMQNLAAAHSAPKEAITPDGRVITVRPAKPNGVTSGNI